MPNVRDVHVHVHVCLHKSILQLDDADLRLRTLDKHYLQCSLVELPDHRQHFSKKYGINRRSVLCKAPHFDVCQCLPHDVMHVMFEGILQLHCGLLLEHCIEQKYVTIGSVNMAIKNFLYGENDKASIPGPVDRERLGSDKGKLAESGWLSTVSCLINDMI